MKKQKSAVETSGAGHSIWTRAGRAHDPSLHSCHRHGESSSSATEHCDRQQACRLRRRGQLRYTITVTNLGARRLSGLLITQTVSDSTRFHSAESNGRNHRGEVRWTLDLPAPRTVTLRTVIAVSKETPPEMRRLAIVACAATSNKGAALVCASDSDQLPAGAQAQRSQAEEDVGAMQMPAWWLIAGPGLILSAFVIGIVAKLRTSWARRRKEPENG